MAILHPEQSIPSDLARNEDVMGLLNTSEVAHLQEYLPSEMPAHILDYQVQSLERNSLKNPEITRTGAHIYQELCTFYDSNGHKIVREATIALPNTNLVEEIPIPVIATDPWTTGVRGLNRIKVRQLVNMGYPVVWLHHADERSPLQRDKSITRSARQIHVLLDDLSGNSDFGVVDVLVDGYSRGGMTGEKFIALGKQHKRNVLFSILDAPCFAEDMTAAEKRATLVRQLPREAMGIASLAVRHFMYGIKHDDMSTLIELAKTPNFHPGNMWQELMWKDALTNARVGSMIEHLPEDTAGIRNFFKKDDMSQIATYVDLYKQRPGIVVEAHDGPHVEGASPEYLFEIRQAQFKRLGEAILKGEKLNAMLIAEQAELDVIKLPLAS